MSLKTVSAPANYYHQGIKNNLGQFIWHTWRFQMIKSFLPQVGSRVLDIGCHGGLFTKKISQCIPEAKIYGIDIDINSIVYAQKKYPQFYFQVAPAEKLPFPNKSFDLITCLEVFEHLKNPKKALNEIRRCLKNNGKVIILVPIENLFFRLIWYFWTKSKGKVWKNTHLQHFSNIQLYHLLKNNGFKIKRKKTSHLGMLLAVEAGKN